MILDTNALSAIAEGEPLLKPILRGASDVSLPVIVLGEYLFGIRQSRNRIRYENWLSSAVQIFRLLRIDQDTAHHYAAIRQELKQVASPIPANDVWIAALARQHSLAILSRDRHFDSVPHVKRITW